MTLTRDQRAIETLREIAELLSKPLPQRIFRIDTGERENVFQLVLTSEQIDGLKSVLSETLREPIDAQSVVDAVQKGAPVFAGVQNEIQLQARKADGGVWTDIFPAQLGWASKGGYEVRALEITPHLTEADRKRDLALSIVTLLANTPTTDWLSKPEIQAELREFKHKIESQEENSNV